MSAFFFPLLNNKKKGGGRAFWLHFSYTICHKIKTELEIPDTFNLKKWKILLLAMPTPPKLFDFRNYQEKLTREVGGREGIRLQIPWQSSLP